MMARIRIRLPQASLPPPWPWEATMLTAANCYLLWAFTWLQFVSTIAYFSYRGTNLGFYTARALEWRERLWQTYQRDLSESHHPRNLFDPRVKDWLRYDLWSYTEHDSKIRLYEERYGLPTSRPPTPSAGQAEVDPGIRPRSGRNKR